MDSNNHHNKKQYSFTRPISSSCDIIVLSPPFSIFHSNFSLFLEYVPETQPQTHPVHERENIDELELETELNKMKTKESRSSMKK